MSLVFKDSSDPFTSPNVYGLIFVQESDSVRKVFGRNFSNRYKLGLVNGVHEQDCIVKQIMNLDICFGYNTKSTLFFPFNVITFACMKYKEEKNKRLFSSQKDSYIHKPEWHN